jgi:HlyD family secretion protein
MKPVTRGISDENHVEITEGFEEGVEIVSGGYKAIAKQLEDGKAVKVDNTVKASASRRGEEAVSLIAIDGSRQALRDGQ